MSRLVVPLLGRPLRRTGDTLVRAELELLLRDSFGVWKDAPFRVDSGTEMTSMPTATAKKLGLPYPQSPLPGLTHPTGQVVRAGIIRAQVVGMDGTEYVFPCFFLGDPQTPAAPGPPSPLSINLLGLIGVVDKLRISLDGTPTSLALYGNLIVEKL